VSSIMIKDMSPELHRRLRMDAKRHHRSMTKHVVAILEAFLGTGVGADDAPPSPVRGRFELTDAWLDTAKRQGRP